MIEHEAAGEGCQIAVLGIERLVEISECARRLNSISAALGMPASVGSSQRLQESAVAVAPYADQLTTAHLAPLTQEMRILVSALHDELQARLLFVIEHGEAAYYSDDTPLFGSVVDDAFPSAAQEISDAGNCRALGRWTACVIHLMRALEPALNALAAHLGVPTNQNWNKTLNEVDSRLREINGSSGGPEAEQWASEASAHLRVVKNAWRNHAAHGRARYDKEQAIAIYDNVRPLMRTLAIRLSE